MKSVCVVYCKASDHASYRPVYVNEVDFSQLSSKCRVHNCFSTCRKIPSTHISVIEMR